MIRRCMTIFRLALPVMISQISMIVVAFADNSMVGHYSTEAFASSSFVVNVFNLVMFCAMGFSYGLTPLVGALFSQGRKTDIGHLVRVALRANLVMGLILTAIMTVLYLFLDKLGQKPELLPIIRPYYLITLAGILPVVVFNVFAQWSFAIRRTAMPMWILLAANALNIVGNYMLIYGHWGAPELGLAGAGVSTLTARLIAMAAILMVFFGRRGFGEYRRGYTATRVSPPGEMRRVVKTSVPVALQMTFETGAFSFAVIFAGWLGTVALAAFQVIVIVGTLGFCIYYSVGTAITVEVSNCAGRSGLPACRRPALDGYVVMLVCAAVSSTIFVALGPTLTRLFTDDPRVISAAVGVLFPLVLYQLGDCTQVTFANALRGTANVMPMLWIAFISYIVIGIPSTLLLAFPAGLGLYGIVLSFSVSLFTAGALFMYTFFKTTHNFTNLK